MYKKIYVVLAAISIATLPLIAITTKKKQPIKSSSTKHAPNIIILEKTKGPSFDDLIKKHKFIVLDFTATWCNPCQNLAAKLPDIASKFEQVKFIKVDADEFKKICKDYSVQCFPTLVYLEDGKELSRSSGFGSPHEIITAIQTHFKIKPSSKSK